MADVPMTEEQITEADKLEEAELLASFEGKTLPEQTASESDSAPAAETKPDPDGEEGKPAETPAAAPEPEYVQITREEAELFRRNLAIVTSMQSDLRAIRSVADKAHGISGDVQKQLRDFASATGRDIPVTKDDFAELAKEYGDVADMVSAGLQRVLKKVPAGAPATAKAEIDPEALGELVRKENQKWELERLLEVYPDWRGVTQAFEGGDPNCEYRAWLRTKPADYQERMAKTGSGEMVKRSLDWFYAEKRAAPATAPDRAATTPTAKPAQRAVPRTAVRQPDRFRAAVTPNGAVRPMTTEPNELDEVMAAFNR